MEWRDKEHPKRDACFIDIKRVGTTGVKFVLCYTVETKTRRTWHREPFEVSLCDARHFAGAMHRIADELQGELDKFRADLEGRNR